MSDEARKYISNQQLQLELKAMRSEFRYWIVGAILANQALAAIHIPQEVTVGAFAVFVGKVVFGLVAR